MEKKVKYWILLSLRQSIGGRGLSVEDLFRNRPSFFDGNISELLDNLRILCQDELTELSSSNKYRIPGKTFNILCILEPPSLRKIRRNPNILWLKNSLGNSCNDNNNFHSPGSPHTLNLITLSFSNL